MVEDRSLCFSTSLREHCIYSRVPCSILHCPLPLPQPPSIGLSCQRPPQRGLRSTNIFCILHFHYQSPIPQGTYRVRLVPQRNLLARQSTSITRNQAFLLPSEILVCSAPGEAGWLYVISILHLHYQRLTNVRYIQKHHLQHGRGQEGCVEDK